MSDYITKAELEEFKQSLITELKNTEVELKEKSTGKLLGPIYKRWFHDATKDYRVNLEKPFRKHFPAPYVWKVWDEIRALTCVVCESKTVAGIRDTEMALDFCEKLCEFIDSYMDERSKGNE